ncbi:putative secreted protein [Aspergillus steynii IBT 23096]|uniref:Putative secreted protein n=1 Tax=Aspergillus steynii IBT 23096 TaxID=1392250 RepID=A0A2I2GH79_9EURO|nr:uncharacterized protein P170DRAFT_402225 [Aspergillus steynii IBT 23096]PLB52232.1 putative secreted protein [Aspergillus steynii IBT 23096]
MLFSRITIPSALGLLPVVQCLNASHFTWYTSGASDFASTLPIGNGRLAAAVWGTPVENITLNENSVWGGPFKDRANPDAYDALGDVRELLQNGSLTEAGQRALADMVAIPDSPQSYHPVASLVLDFGHEREGMEDYVRSLDTYTGTAEVSYVYDGVRYTRGFVASYPGDVLGFRVEASEEGKLDLSVALERERLVLENEAEVVDRAGKLVLKAETSENENPIRFAAGLRVVADGGEVTGNGSSIVVRSASTVNIFFDTETSYRYDSQEKWEAQLNDILDAAVEKGYSGLREEAVKDYTSLIGRVNLDLGSSESAGNQTTDTRLRNYKEKPDQDPELVTLMFNFGRHLLLSSSRRSASPSLPANLQGIWNQDYSPAWGGKYTVNINLEMNYWLAQVTNLAETFEPFVELLETVRPRGEAMAKSMYHCDSGFVLHHNTDLWGDTAPTDNGTAYTIWPMGGAWLASQLMEQYRFTQDKKFLEERIWPLLQSAAHFYYCYLFTFEGYYSTGPSCSPEASFKVPSDMTKAGSKEALDIAPTMDNSLLYELFTAINETCITLSLSSDEDCTTAVKYLAKIKPPQIGSSGRILEWRNEYEESAPGHRHMSPIVGLFPGSQLTPLVNETLAQAAKGFLDRRIESGSGSTGWSRVWTMNLYARLFDGDAVWNHTQTFLQTYPSSNLWNTDGGPGTAFQIDGNFGFVSGIAEMLLQSHEVVHLLPALPSAVETGSVSGLVARGNFEVSIEWKDGALEEATVLSKSGGKLALRVQDGKSFSVDGKKYAEPVETEAGSTYTITLS